MLDRTKNNESIPSEESEVNVPKFNIRARYDDLNTAQKSLLRNQFHQSFGGNLATFYNKLSSENLLADELMFFAGIFDCKIQDLYNPGQEPAAQPSIYELHRKSKGFKYGNQKRLDV